MGAAHSADDNRVSSFFIRSAQGLPTSSWEHFLFKLSKKSRNPYMPSSWHVLSRSAPLPLYFFVRKAERGYASSRGFSEGRLELPLRGSCCVNELWVNSSGFVWEWALWAQSFPVTVCEFDVPLLGLHLVFKQSGSLSKKSGSVPVVDKNSSPVPLVLRHGK